MVIVVILATTLLSFAQRNQQELPKKTRILLLVDGSGSMLAKWESDIRMNIAKRLLVRLVDSLKVNPNVEIGLRVYGHLYQSRLQNCKDSKLEVPFKTGNHETVKQKIRTITPQGNTPIAYSLEQAANDFPIESNVRNIVIIITDGIESCGGDPCAVSIALQRKQIFLKPFVIGIGIDKEFISQFSCLGSYFDAKDVNDFQKALNKSLRQTLEKTTASVELLDINFKPKETNVNVTFINNVTGQPAYDFVHYRDGKGRPDSVTIDAVISYDVLVNTIPPVIVRNIDLEGGEHNVINVQTPQGFLELKQNGHSEYMAGVRALVKKSGSSKIIHIQQVPDKVTYLVGKYDLEILTLPRVHLKDIAINQSAATNIQIPGPGILNLTSGIAGFGSLYVIDDNGQQEWILNIGEKIRESMALQPGSYKVVFRAKNAAGSKYTEIKKFTIKTGSTLNLKLFSK